MKITVNGEAVAIEEKASVSDLLVVREVKMPHMATVHLNETVVDRESYGKTLLKEGDRVEILYFMGGGAHPGTAVNAMRSYEQGWR